MHILKDIAKMGGFGLVGLAATHKLGDVARSGALGIGGAVLAGHRPTPHPVFPMISTMPPAESFKDPASYLQAVQQWASGELGNMQQQQQPGGAPAPGSAPVSAPAPMVQR
jgi:hypothetical protein